MNVVEEPFVIIGYNLALKELNQLIANYVQGELGSI
jgi:hypothetical protein